MLDYFTAKKGKAKAQTQVAEPEVSRKQSFPLFDREDEAFLQHITTEEGTPPPLPERPQDSQVAGDSTHNTSQLTVKDAAQTPLPKSPGSPAGHLDGNTPQEVKKNRWSFLRFDGKGRDRKNTADALDSAMIDSKHAEASGVQVRAVNAAEAKKEQDEVEQVLEQLNLAAVNNTVFSISEETRELLRKFTLVFKDLVHGAPTAYHDLEALITNSEDQIQKMWLGLPPFLQQLVSKLPGKFSPALAPEVLAAAAEKPALKASMLDKGVSAASKAGIKFKIPSLKDLVGKKGALISMFRAILNTLRTRFPAILGLNVLWSIAIAVLLLVCWYCYKRGREVRLEQERAVTEAEMAEIKKQVEADPPAEWNEPMTTLAPEGASIEEVRASLAPAEAARTPRIMEYAEEGSLAQSLLEDNTSQVSKEPDTTHSGEQQRETAEARSEDLMSLLSKDSQAEAQRKAEQRAERMSRHPSQAPLHSQDSCVVS